MARHWEKSIKQAKAAVESTGVTAPRGDAEPMTRAEVESFVKGFGMSASATRRMVDEWSADSDRAREAGWESHADSVWYDEG